MRWRKRLIVGAAADYFFNTKATSALSALAIGAVPIDRTKVSRQSGDMISGLIGEGWSLLIYPEGGRSPDGWGQPFRGGAAYLAIRCGVPVVPIHVSGTGQISASPDIAYAQLGIQTFSIQLDDALNTNNNLMISISNELKK